MKKNFFSFIFLCFLAQSAQSQNDIKVVDLLTNGMAYSKVSDRLWVTVPSNIPQYGNSICRINPNFATIDASFWAGSEPTSLALSTDGRYLYVGFSGTPRIKRFDTQSNIFDQEFYMQGDDTVSISNFYSGDMATIPNKNQSLVVARGNSGLAVFDNGVRRLNTTSDLRGGRSVNFALDSSTVWSLGVPYYGDGLLKLKIDGTGIKAISNSNTIVTDVEYSMKYSPFDSLFYTDGGLAFDIRSGAPVKKFQFGTGFINGYRVLPDPYNNDVYFFFNGNDINVKVYNGKTQIPTDEYIIPIRSFYIAETLNWGGAGKMVLRGNRLIIIRTCTSQAVAPTIIEGATVKGCQGSDIVLTASGTANRYYWSTGDTTRTIRIQKAGTYSVGLADATGCLANSAPTTVVLTDPPSPPSISIGGTANPIAICQDRTVLLYGSSFGQPRYEWSNGTVGNPLTVTQSGTYKCVAISAEGCRSNSLDSVIINILPRNSPPPPLISVIGDTSFCTNARATLSGPNGYVDYRWTGTNSFFAYDQSIVVTPQYTTNYQLIVADSVGCQSLPSSKTIQVTGIERPYAYLFQGLLQTDLADAYQWFLNGVAIKDSIKSTMRPTLNGFYTVQVIRKGCKSLMSAPVNVIRTALTALAANQRFEVSPNPVNDVLRLYTEGVDKGIISVTNVLGRTLMLHPLQTGESFLSVETWQTGIYFVQLKTDSGILLATQRILKF